MKTDKIDRITIEVISGEKENSKFYQGWQRFVGVEPSLIEMTICYRQYSCHDSASSLV